MNNLNPWPLYNSDEINAVTKVLKSGDVNYLTGFQGKEFEKEFSKYVGVKYSVALANGSLALTSAFTVLGLKKGDEIITTPRTYVATVSCAVLLGIKPIFADVDLDSGAITAASIESKITRKTKAICVVHLGGWPAEMEKIIALSKAYSLYLIEDCSQAHGAKLNKKSVGSFGDISTWSFCKDKIISTGGEGGMITTSKKILKEKVWSLKDHGKNFDQYFSEKKSYEFKYIHDSLGNNFRLTEMQSAIGRIQLKKLNSMRLKREKNAFLLASILKDINSIRVPMPDSHIKAAWYKFYFYIIPKYLKSSWTRNDIIKKIVDSGFSAFSGSCSEIYNEKCFSSFDFYKINNLKNAIELGENSIALLVHPTISEDQIINYGETVKRIIIEASIN